MISIRRYLEKGEDPKEILYLPLIHFVDILSFLTGTTLVNCIYLFALEWQKTNQPNKQITM